ncbi:MAG: hypothetical protein WBY94_26700 [Polyangiaceae bacterium]
MKVLIPWSTLVFVVACSSRSSNAGADAGEAEARAPVSDSSVGPAASDANTEVAVADDDGSCESGGACDSAVGNQVLGAMRLFELAGSIATDSGPSAVTQLDAAASFHVAVPDDYDDRQAGIGCTADHYDATTKPAPADADAGWLRMSGFAGGTLLAGGPAAQPIICARTGGYYQCTYPTETPVSGAFFADTDPLGPGPITFASPGAADFGARAVSGSPIGTATTAEDLNAVHYSSSVDTILHVACSNSCATGRIAVNLTAEQASTANLGWPYSSVGIVRCVFAAAASVAIPHAAIAAMFAQDAALDVVLTAVVLLPTAPLTTTDAMGNRLVAEVGRGTFGAAPR